MANNNNNNRRKKCGVCQATGHDVRRCANPVAITTVAILMNNPSLESALCMCRQMSAGHVLFALCHGFDTSTNGGRNKLITCITQKFEAQAHAQAQAQAEAQAQVQETDQTLQPFALQTFVLDNSTDMMRSIMSTFQHESLESDVTPEINHPSYWGGMTAPQRHHEIARVANHVMIQINTSAANYSNPGAYIETITRTSLYHEILDAATNLSLILSTRAFVYVITVIRVQNCRRRGYEVPPPPPAESMKTLKTVITCRPSQPDAPDTTCGVCFDEFSPRLIVKTGCGHDFCADCMCGWAKQRGIKSFIQCPSCREEIDALTVGDQSELKKVRRGIAPIA